MYIPRQRYAVVGGGLSGLSVAYFISLLKGRTKDNLTLFESSHKLGGCVQTVRNPASGSYSDLGPHSARIGSKTSSLLLRMTLNLGLRDSIVWLGAQEKINNRYIFLENRLRKFSPTDFSYASPFTRSHLGLFVNRLLKQKPPQANIPADVSIDDFFRTRLDNEFADYFASAMVRGIFAGDSRKLSIRACLPQVVEAEKNGRNLIQGLISTQLFPTSAVLPDKIEKCLPSDNKLVPAKTFAWSLPGGMQDLVDSLTSELQSCFQTSVQLITETRVDSIRPRSNGKGFTISASNVVTGEILESEADVVFLCLPAFNAADVLLKGDFLPPHLISHIQPKNLPWGDIAVCVLELKGRVRPPVEGFGHLVPRCEDPNILGVIYDSVCLSHLDGDKVVTSRFSVMMKPFDRWLMAHRSTISSESTDLDSSLSAEIEHTALKVLSHHLGICAPQVVSSKSALWRQCIPQYPVGHTDNIASFRDGIQSELADKYSPTSKIHFVGSSYDGVSLGDVVFSSVNAVAAQIDSEL